MQFRLALLKYIKYNITGTLCFGIATFLFFVFGGEGWFAWLVSNGIAGFIGFILALRFAFTESWLFVKKDEKVANS